MDQSIVQNLFIVLAAALVGGVGVRLLRLPSILGYIFAGILGGMFFPTKIADVEGLAEVGIILLLFSVGLELSLTRLTKVGSVASLGSILQMLAVTLISLLVLSLIGFPFEAAVVLSLAFSLSSTALVVKMLGDRGESDTLHGEIMIGWLLVQDLAVIPMVALLPILAGGQGASLSGIGESLLASFIVVSAVFFLGRLVAPFLIHKVASTNSRELLVLTGISLALGTAFLVSVFGISASLGAFLAGVVISESQENHAIFAETRPLRDLFVILFFVTLGFLVNPEVLLSNFGMILGLALLVLTLKFIVVFLLLVFWGYRGKTAIAASIGLTQIGEFSFVLFIASQKLGIMDEKFVSIGIATTLLTLILTPFLFKGIVPFWRWSKNATSRWGKVGRLFNGWTKSSGVAEELKNHIIICGYGRMGSWIGWVLTQAKIPFVIVEYNQKVVRDAKMSGLPVVYGDPMEQEVLEEAGIKSAKAIVIAIPDRVAQEEIISKTQTLNPEARVFARAHLDEDFKKLSQLRVKRVVQPEFEAAVAVIREMLVSMGKSKEEIIQRIKGLRTAHATKK